jgi:ABC-type amino acid transport substrate-binding protein
MKLSLFFLVLQIFFIAPSFSSIESSEIEGSEIESPDKQEFKNCMFLKKTEGIRYFLEDIVKELSVRSNLSFVNVDAPIKRCLQMMIAGEIDFMLSIHVTEERLKYIDYLFVSEGFTKIIFYTRKDEGDWLNDYEDLKGKTVGTTVGFNYFEKFDVDDSFKKVKVSDPKQLPKMLAAGRIDSYVTHSGLMEADAKVYSELVKSPYLFGVDMSFLAISKESKLQPHRPLLVGTIKSIISDGTMEKLSSKHIPGFKLPFTQ